MGNLFSFMHRPGHHAKDLPSDPNTWDDEDFEKAGAAIFQGYDSNLDDILEYHEVIDVVKDIWGALDESEYNTASDPEGRAQEIMGGYARQNPNGLHIEEFVQWLESHVLEVCAHGDAKKKRMMLHGLEHAINRSMGSAQGEVRLIVVGLNYAATPELELTALDDALNMIKIAEQAGVKDITRIFDDGNTDTIPTNSNVLAVLKEVGSRCTPNDVLIFFYAGHGCNVEDTNGDEEDGEDEAFCTVGRDGTFSGEEHELLIDDDFSRTIDYYIDHHVRILVLTDCCHSGSIADIDSFDYKHEIIAIAAAKDSQEALDMSTFAEEKLQGGALTCSMMKTLDKLHNEKGGADFSVEEVFNSMKKFCKVLTDKVGHDQDVSIQSANIDPAAFAWPVPKGRMTTGWHLRFDASV